MSSQTIAISPFNRTGIADSPMFSKPPRVADCTLRDGEQQVGVVFSRQDKLELAKALDEIGLYELEVGTPAVSEDDRQVLEEISALGLNAKISALSRAKDSDIDTVARAGAWGIRLSLPISPRQRDAKIRLDDDQYLDLALRVCSYSKSLGLHVIFSPYDTTRCDLRLLERLMNLFAKERCTDRVRVVDTTGAASPQSIDYLVQFMKENSGGIPIEVHCHDDFGLATANTIAGAIAGADYLSVTVNGLGERSGNACLEEVVMAMQVMYGVDLGVKTEPLKSLSELVERCSGVHVQPNKGVVGQNAFSHESGMVVAGVLKDPFTAESYAPELVGQKRTIVLGKKSGGAAVEFKLKQAGLAYQPEQIAPILSAVKSQAITLRRSLSDSEFAVLAQEVLAGKRG